MERMTPRQRVFATVHGQRRDRIPVTPLFMQFAARFIGRTFRDYYLDGAVLAEAQVAVAAAFGTDHVAVLGEPWAEADSYGMPLDYPPEGVGIPRGFLLRSRADVDALPELDPHAMPRLRQRLVCIERLRAAEPDQCVVGWVEGPFAEYVDLRGMQEAMTDLYDDPDLFHAAAERLVRGAARFAAAQRDAGADIIGVGDAAASLIGPALYGRHVLPWQQRLIAAIRATGALVKLHMCGNIAPILPLAATTGADILDCDWMVDLAAARRAVGPDMTLAGNFNPAGVLLRGAPPDIAEAARRCIRDAGARFILQPGCEVPPDTAHDNLRAFCPGQGCLIADALRPA